MILGHKTVIASFNPILGLPSRVEPDDELSKPASSNTIQFNFYLYGQSQLF